MPESSSEINLMTPLHDPSGQALKLFEQAIWSVLSQNARPKQWYISIQEVSPQYNSVLEHLRSLDWISIRCDSEANSLRENMNFLLRQIRVGKFQILCQDDVLFNENTLEIISNELSVWDAIFTKPRIIHAMDPTLMQKAFSVFPPYAIRPAKTRYVTLEKLGVNIFGGLSTISWNTVNMNNELVLEFDYFADLNVRNLLRQQGLNIGEITGENLVAEHNWFGQSQRKFDLQKNSEIDIWVNLNSPDYQSPHHNAFRVALSGHLTLAQGWFKCKTLKLHLWFSGIAILYTLSFMTRATKYIRRKITLSYFGRLIRRIQNSVKLTLH